MIRRRRELMVAYVLKDPVSWRRVYPETFYTNGSFVNAHELEFIDKIYEIFRTVINGHRKTLIEDEINLMYMEIESRAALGKFSEEVVLAIQGRLDLKKQVIQRIEALGRDVESKLPDVAHTLPRIRFRLESTVYLVRLMSYGLFSDRDIVLERVAEVFDISKLQAAVKPRDRRNMDGALKFLYRGLIQKNERGQQGNRHAARQALGILREWFSDNEYIITCIEKIGRYM